MALSAATSLPHPKPANFRVSTTHTRHAGPIPSGASPSVSSASSSLSNPSPPSLPRSLFRIPSASPPQLLPPIPSPPPPSHLLASGMAAPALWALVFLSAAVAVAFATEATAAAKAANEVLRAHQLPGGLLPAGITEFRHDEGTGRFEAELEAPCTARFEVGLRYNATVTGVISAGQIAAISGVAAQDLFMWFPVHDIKVDIPSSGVIYFNVGVVKKHLPLAVFDAPPACTPDTDPLILTTVPFLRTPDPEPLLLSTVPLPQRLEDGGLAMGAAASSRR